VHQVQRVQDRGQRPDQRGDRRDDSRQLLADLADVLTVVSKGKKPAAGSE